MKKVLQLLFIILVGSAALKLYSQSPFDTSIYGRNKAAGHYIKTRGFSMYYEAYGNGEPLPSHSWKRRFYQ